MEKRRRGEEEKRRTSVVVVRGSWRSETFSGFVRERF
jgi:hypothetical protein